jgi:hypothetical protein
VARLEIPQKGTFHVFENSKKRSPPWRQPSKLDRRTLARLPGVISQKPDFLGSSRSKSPSWVTRPQGCGGRQSAAPPPEPDSLLAGLHCVYITRLSARST